MSLLTTLFWIFLACAGLMVYALLIVRGAKLMEKAVYLDQRAQQVGRYSRWDLLVRSTPWLVGSLSLAAFFDTWSIKFTVFTSILVIAVIIEFKKVREIKARYELTKET